MIKLTALAALLTLGSESVLAQGVPPPFVSPGSSPGGGLTVVGRGNVVVPPDRARVTVRLIVQQQQTAGVNGSIDESGHTIANALRAAGVADANYELPLEGNLGANSQPAVVGTLAKPTRESLERIARATLKALPPTLPGLQTFQISIAYVVDDCSAAETRAQVAALADARARGGRAAAAAGVHLGPIVAINESGTFPAPGCGAGNTGFTQSSFSNLDAFGPLGVAVAVVATVTFAIR